MILEVNALGTRYGTVAALEVMLTVVARPRPVTAVPAQRLRKGARSR